MEAEKKFDFLAADDFTDRFHGALAAGALERIAAPDLENQVTPEGAHVAGGLLRRRGNERKTIIGPGDSGGPVLVEREGGPVLAGVITFAERFGGRFGDVGGGVLMGDGSVAWVDGVTGIPEPAGGLLVVTEMALFGGDGDEARSGAWMAVRRSDFVGGAPQAARPCAFAVLEERGFADVARTRRSCEAALVFPGSHAIGAR